MPGGDRTGPLGLGPGTGRALGYCYGYDSPGYTKWSGAGFGRGFGRGSGMGRGFGWGFHRGFPVAGYIPGYPMPYPWTYSMSKDDEIRLLKSQADALSRAQKEIEKRLSDLGKKEE